MLMVSMLKLLKIHARTEVAMENAPLLEGISSGAADRIVLARISIGADLLQAIHQAVKREKITKGLIIMGIGALKRAVFRNLKVFPKKYPITPEDRIYFEAEGPLEILSLTGYIVPGPQGEAHVHAHFSASAVRGDGIVTYGGHLDYGAITHVKAAVAICALRDMEMGKRWVEERKTHDMWVGAPPAAG
jgi:predicted DNA-binding protein with PD1-like motif